MAASDINIRIGAKLDGLQREIKKAQSQLTRFADFAENTGRSLSTRLSLPIIGVGVAAVSSFAKFERLELGLKALATEGEDAGETLSRLRKIAELPGVDLSGVVNASSQFRSVGFEAAQAEKIIVGLSKAVTLSSVGPEQFDAIVRQFVQMSSKGRILQEDLSIILENVPSIGLAIDGAFGTRNIDKIKETGISTQQFTAEIIKAIDADERFQKAQGGVANEIENFGQSINFALAGLGRTIAESINLSGILQSLSGFVNRASEGFQKLSPDLQRAIIVFAGFAAAIGPVLLGLGALVNARVLLSKGLGALSGTFATIISGPIGKFSKFILSLVGNFRLLATSGIARSLVLAKGIGFIKTAISTLLNPLNLLIVGFTAAYTRSQTFRDIIGSIIDKLKTIGIKVINSFAGSFSGLGEIGSKVVGILAGVVSVIANLLSATISFIGGILGAVKRLASGDFSGAWSSIKTGAVDAFSAASNVVTDFQQVYQETANGLGSFKFPVDALVTKTDDTTKKPGPDGKPVRLTAEEYARLGTSIQEVIALERELQFIRANGRPAGIIQATAAITSQTAAVQGLNGALSASITDVGAKFQALPTQVSFAQESLNQYGAALSDIDQRSLVFGASFDALGAKISATKAAIDTALGDGFTAASENVVALVTELSKLEVLDTLAGGIQSVGAAIGNVAAEGALSFQSFAKAAVSAIGDVIAALIQQGVAAAIANAFKNPVGVIPPLGAALAAGAGLAAAGLFKGLLKAIPGLADGGIIPPGFSGDKFPAFLNSGEAVIPLDRLFKELGGGAGGSGEFVVRGQDLVLVMDRANNSSRRVNGR
jgi:tape measure domain-containing protein